MWAHQPIVRLLAKVGSKGKIVSIQPPVGFGKEIWEELAEKGYLKRDGGGFYELVPGK